MITNDEVKIIEKKIERGQLHVEEWALMRELAKVQAKIRRLDAEVELLELKNDWRMP